MSRSITRITTEGDSFLFWALTILIIFGLLMLFTSSMVVSKEKTRTEKFPEGSAVYYFFHQFLLGLLPGVLMAFFASKFSLNYFRRISILVYLLAIVLLIIVFIPSLNFQAKGAASWIKIKEFTFQPSEFAKLSLIIYLAAFFDRKIRENKIKSTKEGLLSFLCVLAPFAILLMAQPDMGTFGVIAIISFIMFFIAGAKLSHIILLIILGILLIFVGALLRPHQAQRIITFINPEKDALGISYQINQSLIAIGSGGIFGVGIGNSLQKYNYLPEPMGDTIFSVWAEETGFIGCLIIISLYLILTWRGFIISKRAPNKFTQLMAIGIVSWISIQAFLNIMAVTGLIPFTGLPLPFVSYGGSAIIATLTAMGILINISKHTI